MGKLKELWRISGLAGAVRTLTILPWPGPAGRQEDLAEALAWFPLVGAMIGVLLSLLCGGLSFVGPEWAAGVAAVVVVSEWMLTRGLHMDGLADWADALGVFEPAHRLAVMKDSRVGTFGVLSLMGVTLAKWASIQRFVEMGTVWWLIWIFALTRSMMVELITTCPSARAGQGTAGPFIAGATPGRRWASHGLCLLLCLFFGPVAILGIIVAWVLTRVFRSIALQGFGGMTGDLLGAWGELLATLLLLTCAFAGPRLLSAPAWG